MVVVVVVVAVVVVAIGGGDLIRHNFYSKKQRPQSHSWPFPTSASQDAEVENLKSSGAGAGMIWRLGGTKCLRFKGTR